MTFVTRAATAVAATPFAAELQEGPVLYGMCPNG